MLKTLADGIITILYAKLSVINILTITLKIIKGDGWPWSNNFCFNSKQTKLHSSPCVSLRSFVQLCTFKNRCHVSCYSAVRQPKHWAAAETDCIKGFGNIFAAEIEAEHASESKLLNPHWKLRYHWKTPQLSDDLKNNSGHCFRSLSFWINSYHQFKCRVTAGHANVVLS